MPKPVSSTSPSYERWREIDRVFSAALDAPEEGRAALIDRECGDDRELRAEVMRLLDADRRAEEVLGNSAASFASPLLDARDSEDRLDATEVAAAVAGRYEVQREIGRGGMATVYLARDPRHERLVALKVLAPGLAAAIGPERFHREIRIAGLQHPHILPVFDSGSANGVTWYAMPYIEGESLRDLLKRAGTLPVERAVAIVREVADALDHAHARGIVHRDIKPENILLSGGHALVADFGIARSERTEAAVTSARTAPGLAMGTPAYMSPEQASGAYDVDGRSDIYSLGCVLYELLVGQAPFSGITSLAALRKRLTEPIPVPSEMDSTIPRAIDLVVARALATDPAERFSSASELARALSTVAGPSSRARNAWLGVGLVAAIVLVVALSALGIRAALSHRAASTTPVLAVLPFRNLGGSSDQYFADGLTEEIASRLARTPGIIVRRGSPGVGTGSDDRQPAQIGRDYRASYVLTGTVRWSPDAAGGRGASRVRVTPRLIRVSDQRELIGETIDTALVDIFQVQSGIAERVFRVLGVVLQAQDRARLASRPTENIEAWDHYTRGNFHLARRTPDAVLHAISAYESALAIDSSFSRARSRRAYAHILFVDWGWPFPGLTSEQLQRRAADLTTEAVARDSGSAESWLAKAYLQVVEDPYRLLGAIASFRRSLAIDSTNAEVWHQYGQALMVLGRDEEAVAAYNRALALEPERPMTLVPLSAMARIHGRLADARRFADSAISLRGVSTPYARAVHGVYLLAQGDAAGARRDAEVALAMDSSYAAPARSVLVEALAQLGDTASALRQLDRLRENVNPRAPSMTDARFFGAALVALHRDDELIDMLDRVRPRGAWLWFYLKSPDFDRVRGDPRFRRIFDAANPQNPGPR